MKGPFRSGMRGRREGYHTPVGANCGGPGNDQNIYHKGRRKRLREHREEKAKLMDLAPVAQTSARRGRREKIQRRLLRADGAVINPSLHRGHKFRAAKRWQRASVSGIPAPAD